VNADRIREDILAKKSRMVAKASQHIVAMYQIEQLVKAALANEDEESIHSGYYQAFARQIYHLRLIHPGGKILNKEVSYVLDTWKKRTLNETVLAKVRDAVFSIPAA
jgi:hypothetical protein